MLDSVEVPSKQAQMSDSGWKSAIRYGAVASISRFLIALVLIMGLQGTIAPGPFAPTGNNFFSNFQRWDSNWLNLIAAHGYTTTQRTVFFPGFPLTIRAVSALSAHNLTDTMAGVLISWLAFGISSILLYKLVDEVLNSHAAKVSTAMFCLSPGSLFFLNAYTESATTLTTIAASLLLRRKKYFLAAVVAGIASCVSPVGALFGVALFVAVLYNKLGIVKAIALGIVSEIGALSYALFLYIRFHNPLQNIAAESYWQRHTVFPFSAIWRNILFLFTRKVTFAPVPLPQSNHNMFTVWIIDDFVGVVALVVLGVVALKLLRKKLPQNMPVDWLVFFALSAVLINSSDITVIYNIPSTEAVARLLGSVFPFYPLAYIAFHRLKIIFPILLSVGAALAVIAQIFEILDFWMT